VTLRPPAVLRYDARVSGPAERRRIVVDGVAVLDYVEAVQARPVAEDVRALGPLDQVVQVVLDRFAGRWLTSENDELTDALLRNGASIVRHAHVHTCALPRRDGGHSPAATDVARFRVEPIDRSPEDLAELSVLAYPPTHVDFETDLPDVAAVEIRGLLDGTLLGPFLDTASAQVLDHDRLVAACIINRMPRNPPWGGPWVSEVFRDPDSAYRGLGAALLDRAATALEAAGESTLSLAVTDGNPAVGVYETLGFERVATSRKILIPPD